MHARQRRLVEAARPPPCGCDRGSTRRCARSSSPRVRTRLAALSTASGCSSPLSAARCAVAERDGRAGDGDDLEQARRRGGQAPQPLAQTSSSAMRRSEACSSDSRAWRASSSMKQRVAAALLGDLLRQRRAPVAAVDELMGQLAGLVGDRAGRPPARRRRARRRTAACSSRKNGLWLAVLAAVAGDEQQRRRVGRPSSAASSAAGRRRPTADRRGRAPAAADRRCAAGARAARRRRAAAARADRRVGSPRRGAPSPPRPGAAPGRGAPARARRAASAPRRRCASSCARCWPSASTRLSSAL